MTKFESPVKVIPFSQERVYGKLSDLEREPNKCIKLETTNSPLPFNMWIQLVATGGEECKLKVTIGMELNPFMKAMVQKPLQEGLEKMADMLAMIQY